MRLLGIDYGEKYIGIAVTDELSIAAHPLTTVICDKTEFDRIKELIKKHEVNKIIIGLPKNMDGSSGKSVDRVLVFADELKKVMCDVPIEFIDERLTTREAEERLIGLGVSRKKKKSKINQLSACIILESYLNRLNNP
ncbi:MAG: hypothetical protein AUJ85_02250 [Elusimicrobia bacterium CG1_02_37_114]|nr:MAG: hypothetical protein AUJ85_02250 [Elusimicrobia bacterium CG1_02_37_114]PIV53662.1 MAG: Holliday junction resolvase RuvX [Elusimicrobia bacterium CG02_land_8_20_14_3_00_37_13]